METKWDGLRLEQTAQQRVVLFFTSCFFVGIGWLVGGGVVCLFGFVFLAVKESESLPPWL